MSSASVKNVASKSSLHSHKAKVEILSSIFNLLNAGLARGADDPYWFFCEYLGDQGAKKRFRRRFGTFKAGSDKDQVSWRADISVRVLIIYVDIGPTHSNTLLTGGISAKRPAFAVVRAIT